MAAVNHMFYFTQFHDRQLLFISIWPDMAVAVLKALITYDFS